ncbi:putative quinol monooxygenase [Aureimonas sp. SK2]|uniref:putative quinol monooxygenase n=1 Tax=Aureimonas sp. SK2 TaxID=3015992 RepID=UPI002443791C|nr:putative quinol monooxygenase [Aureimonas sp. SK2]
MTDDRSNEIQLVATLTAKPGREGDLRQALLTILADVRQEPGCLRYDMHEDRDHPARIVMLETWEDEAALTRHAQAPAFTGLAARFDELLAEPLALIRLKRIG